MNYLKALKRRCLRVTGTDAERFLNGMWTCDFKLAVKNLNSQTHSLVCGSGLLLNTKGKSIAETVFLCRAPTEFLLMITENEIQAAFDALDRLLVADDVELKILAKEEEIFSEIFMAPNSLLTTGSSHLEPLVERALDRLFLASKEEWGVRIPRNLLNSRHEEYWVYKNHSLPFEFELLSDENCLKLFLDAGVPEWGRDFGKDSLPLEFPLFHEISYHKGCYIGQEVIARATYRGHMVRGWVRVTSKNAEPLLTDYIFSSKDPEKPIGKLTTVLENRGMGLLRFAGLEVGQDLFQKTPEGKNVYLGQIENLLPEVKGN